MRKAFYSFILILLSILLCVLSASCSHKGNESESSVESTIPESKRTIYNWPMADSITITVNGYSADFKGEKWRSDITEKFIDLEWMDIPKDKSFDYGKKELTVDFNTGRAVIKFTQDGKYAILNSEQYAIAEDAFYYIDLLAEAND